MKVTILALVVGGALAAVVPALAQTTTPPSDTGNMAYPAPSATGNVGGGTATPPTDTGNMAYPAPAPQGTLGTTTTPGGPNGPSAGSASAFPAPAPQGNVGTTTVAPK